MNALNGGTEEGSGGAPSPSSVPPPGTGAPTARVPAKLPLENDAIQLTSHMRPPDSTVPAPRVSMHGAFATREVDGEAGPRARHARPRLQDAFAVSLETPQQAAQLSPPPTVGAPNSCLPACLPPSLCFSNPPFPPPPWVLERFQPLPWVRRSSEHILKMMYEIN